MGNGEWGMGDSSSGLFLNLKAKRLSEIHKLINAIASAVRVSIKK
jgi:hypothetical protein